MRFNFKKIAALGTSVILAGMSMGFAAAASYPAPFVQGGSANVAIVYGDSAQASDISVANSIASDLNTTLMGSSTSTVSAPVSVSGGESVTLATNSRSLYYGDAINSGYTSLSSSEMPNTLTDGTFTDLSGTQYTYTQAVTPGAIKSKFGNDGGNLDDPALYLNMGSGTGSGSAAQTAPLYTYTLSFNKNVNVSDTTNVVGQELNIMGVNYVIGAGSTSTTLNLYGAGQPVTVTQGSDQTVNLPDGSHTVSLVAATGTNSATISVDGVQRSVTQGSSYTFAGDINIYVKTITYQAYQGGVQNVELLVGANTLQIKNGTSVKQGSNLDTVKGTYATITSAGSGEISGLSVSVSGNSSQNDALMAGSSFVDPVFGGLKLTFAGSDPGLNDSSRGSVVVDAGSQNTQQSKVTFTSSRDSSAGAYTLTYAYDNSTSGVNPALAHESFTNGKGYIHVLEGENAKVNDYLVLDQGDNGVIAEVSDISIDNSNTGTVTLTDVITGQDVQVTLTNSSSNVYSKTGVNMFGGTGYTIKAAGNGSTVNVTWSGANTKTVFPRIKLADGGWLALMQNTTVTNATKAIFPNGKTTLDTTGTTLDNSSTTYSANGIVWTATHSGTLGTTIKITGIQSGSNSCSFANGPAILFVEPKRWNYGSYGDFICVPLSTTNSGKDMAVSQAVINGTNSGFVALNSETGVQEAVDQYGTLVTDQQLTNQNGKEMISYPTDQMTMSAVLSSSSATVSGGSSSSSTQLGNVVVKASEVSSVNTKNLIVVGGSCVNSAAASLLGVPAGTCGSSWTAATGLGSGQFLIKSFGSSSQSLTSGIAVLVAGTDAADTLNAATALMHQMPDVSAGKSYTGTTSDATLTTVA